MLNLRTDFTLELKSRPSILAAIDLFLANGATCIVELPGKHVVCSRCEGKGSHTNPNVDGHGITADEWANEWDDDTREGYMSGRYDVACEDCGGDRVLTEVDEDRLTPKQRRRFVRWQAQEDRRQRQAAADRRTQYWENGGQD